MFQFLVYNNTTRGKLCNLSQQLPRQPGWWAVASTFVALSQHELIMMGKEASKRKREDKADDSHGEDDAGEAWRLQGGPYHPPFWQCHVTRKPGQVLCVEVLRQWLSSTTPASCLGNLDGGP